MYNYREPVFFIAMGNFRLGIWHMPPLVPLDSCQFQSYSLKPGFHSNAIACVACVA